MSLPNQSQKFTQGTKDRKEKKTGRVALILSILFHSGILLLIGSIVLIPAVISKSAFTADPNITMPHDSTMEEAPDTNQNELPTSEVPKETVQVPDGQAQEVIVSRIELNANASAMPFVAAAPQIKTKAPEFQKKEESVSIQEQKKVSVGAKLTLFGSTETEIKGLLHGEFYDIYRNKNGAELPKYPSELEVAKEFVRTRGNSTALKPYWKSQQVLYATQIAIPEMRWEKAFEAFEEKTYKPQRAQYPVLAVHYRGMIATPSDMTFRFTGMGSRVLIVLIDGELMFCAEYADNEQCSKKAHQKTLKKYKDDFNWESPEEVYSIVENPETVEGGGPWAFYSYGKWMTWKANEYHRIDILIESGWSFLSFLAIQDKDKTYKKLSTDIPVLPLFRVGKRDELAPVISKNRVYSLGGIDASTGTIFLCK